jgi:hypothetical protein
MECNYKVQLNKEGSSTYTKISYPVRYGIYSQVEGNSFIYQFNLNGELKFLKYHGGNWSGDEWLKRTVGNDWIYYTPGIYKGIESYIGEFYLPCFNYPSNSIFAYRPFEDDLIISPEKSLDALIDEIREGKLSDSDPEVSDLLDRVVSRDSCTLRKRSEEFHIITGGRISVLPPDARHVDYDVIPLNIVNGCLYNCRFCMVKSGNGITVKKPDEIKEQVQSLKKFYGNDLINYNSLFLGNHDGLYADCDLITFAAEYAYEHFGFSDSYMNGSHMFLFGSINSFLNSPQNLYESLDKLPCHTYINIGLESADEKTLKILGKPVKPKEVSEAFLKMIEINRGYPGIEVTVNFLLSEEFSQDHTDSLIELCNSNLPSRWSRGAVYLSPLNIDRSSVELQNSFKLLKRSINLPAYIYLIQRL